jgi:hypothetical protein
MDRKRLVRLGCILFSNGTIFFFALRLLRAYGAYTALEAHFDEAIGAVVSLGCLVGFVAEITLRSWAKIINIVVPAAVAAFMASAVVWLPAVTDDGDRYDAALGLLLYASAPLFLAFINYLAYRLTKEEKPSGPGTLRNSIAPD